MGGSKRKFGSSRRKKRTFCKNQYSKKPKHDDDNNGEHDEEIVPGPSRTVTERKLSGSNIARPSNASDKIQGNRFMDMDLLAPVFNMFPCPNCYKTDLKLMETNKYGLACKFEICCKECDWKHSFLNTKKTHRSYQINRRAHYAMRRIGGGHEKLKRFFCLMNHPPLSPKRTIVK